MTTTTTTAAAGSAVRLTHWVVSGWRGRLVVSRPYRPLAAARRGVSGRLFDGVDELQIHRVEPDGRLVLVED